MNNEIKEILKSLQEDIENNVLIEVRGNYFKPLLEFIINLQQENERIKQPKIFIDTQDMEERYGEELYKEYLEKQVKDYKSRIEKAVEYVKECYTQPPNIENFMHEGEMNYLSSCKKCTAIM